MPHLRLHAQTYCLFVAALAPVLLAPVLATAGHAAGPPSAVALYQLETTCSLRGARPVDCVVDVREDKGATVYRHTIGTLVETIRISDGPLRMDRLNTATGKWRSLRSAEVQFSSNTVCFDERDLCVLNPNYLNSVREERVDELEGRDRVLVLFGDDGRVLLTCYDQGCEAVR
jgi:hypothetical protein